MQIPPAAGHDVKPSAFAAHSPPKGVQATGAINQSDTFLEKMYLNYLYLQLSFVILINSNSLSK